ncbi:MAG: DUF2971 domain-containing protein [Bryobacteraceae bacterium]
MMALTRPTDRRPPRPETLFHYTCSESCFEIIRTSKLWASSAFCTNDATEIEYGVRLVQNVAKEYLSDNELARINPYIRSWLAEICVACFSAPPADQLSQWRAYAKNGAGYAIGLRTTLLEQAGRKMAFDLVPVIYNRKQQRSELRKLFEDNRPTDMSNSARIMLKAVRRALSFKNASFREENEWRLVSARPLGRPPPFQYRATRWGVMPYVEIPFDRDSINEVWLGPALDHKLTERTLEMFIRHCASKVRPPRQEVRG